MTFESFWEIYADAAPTKLLHVLMENIGYYAEDMVAVAEAKHNRNEKDADYWRGEVRAMAERIMWLRARIEKALTPQEPVRAEDEHTEMGLRFAECGNCHNAIRRPWAYCPFCGKAVKWDG